MSDYTRNFITNPSFEGGVDEEREAFGGGVIEPVFIDDDTMEGVPPIASIVAPGETMLQLTTTGPEQGWRTLPVALTQDCPEGVTLSGHALGRDQPVTITVRMYRLDDSGVGRVVAQTPGLTVRGWERFALTAPDPASVGSQFWFEVTCQRGDGQPGNARLVVDCVQLEPGQTMTGYVDGDQPDCYWEGEAHNSASVRDNLFKQAGAEADDVCADQTFVLELDPEGNPVERPVGLVTVAVIPQRRIAMSASAWGRCDGDAYASVGEPVAAFDDFAVYPAVGYADPAQTYTYGPGAQVTGVKGKWTRPYLTAIAPRQYLVPDPRPGDPGHLRPLWKRAAYASVNFAVDTVPPNEKVLVDGVSVTLEDTRQDNGATKLSPYCAPRKHIITLLPARLNLIPNPSFEVSLKHWTPEGDADLTQAASVPDPIVPTDAEIEEQGLTDGDIAELAKNTIKPKFGSKFGALTFTTLGEASASISVKGTRPGDYYSLSGYLYLKPPVTNIQINTDLDEESILEIEGALTHPYGSGPYGDIPYGGGSNEVPWPEEDDPGFPYGGCTHLFGESAALAWKTPARKQITTGWSIDLKPVADEPDEIIIRKDKFARARWKTEPGDPVEPPPYTHNPDCIPYGGGEESPYAQHQWVRFWMTGRATGQTATIRISASGNVGGVLAMDGLLLEEGTTLGDYFDGDGGQPPPPQEDPTYESYPTDYRWEYVYDIQHPDGEYRRGESRSFYYPGLGSRRVDKAGGSVQGVRELIAEYLPFGLPFTVNRITTLPDSDPRLNQ